MGSGTGPSSRADIPCDCDSDSFVEFELAMPPGHHWTNPSGHAILSNRRTRGSGARFQTTDVNCYQPERKTIMNTPLRAAVIGCGTVSYAHLWGWRSLAPLVELVAAADPSPEARQARAAEFGVPQVHAEAGEMLERERPDLVSICSPPQTHRQMVELAVRSGARGILCEKPMALTAADAAEMVRVCQAAGVRLALGYQLRSQLYNCQAAQLVQDGIIGQPLFARAICGGSMISTGTHTFDLLRYVLGDPALEWVMGQAVFGDPPYWDGGPAEETSATGYYRLAGDITALFEGGEAASAFHHIFLEGTEGHLQIRPFDEPKASYRRFEHWDWQVIDPLADPEIPPLPEGAPPLPDDRPGWDLDPGDECHPFRLEMLELVQCVRQGREHRASGELGRASLEAVLGLYESARRRDRGSFPLT